ncbi:hypothetical protein [Shewanella sp. BJSY2023SW005]
MANLLIVAQAAKQLTIALPGDAVNGLALAEQRGGAVNADTA